MGRIANSIAFLTVGLVMIVAIGVLAALVFAAIAAAIAFGVSKRDAERRMRAVDAMLDEIANRDLVRSTRWIGR